MLGRRGNWPALWSGRRPAMLEWRSRRRHGAQGLKTSPRTLESAASANDSIVADIPRSPSRESISSFQKEVMVTPCLPASVVLAAPAAAVLSESAASAPLAKFRLRDALGTRDAFKIFVALLQDQHRQLHRLQFCDFSGVPPGELEELLSCPDEEAELLATIACACVAVTLSPSDWPPWVSVRFQSSGIASTPVDPQYLPAVLQQGVSVTAEAAEKKDNAQLKLRGCSFTTQCEVSQPHTPAKASPLHTTAGQLLRHLASRLPSQSVSYNRSPRLCLLKWLTLLCGVSVAPSEKTALRLAEEVSRVSLDAAGVVLASFCATQTLALGQLGAATTADLTSTREMKWLELWMQLTKPGVRPPSLPPFRLDEVVASPATTAFSKGLASRELREGRVSWHLHCLVATKNASHAARLLLGTRRDALASLASESSSSVTPSLEPTSLPVMASTQAELLSALPLPLLEMDGLGKSLTLGLLSYLKRLHTPALPASPVSKKMWTDVPHAMMFAPAVTAHAVLYARMLRYMLSFADNWHSKADFTLHLHDLGQLLRHGNAYALAASLVPVGEPLMTVMVARSDTHRQRNVHHLVDALRQVVDALCHEPVPQPFTEPAQEGDGPVTAPTSKRETTVRRPSAQVSIECTAEASVNGAASWHWREEALADVEDTVQAAVGLLTSLLELCSSRKSSLPLRTAEPKWRRELRQRTAVRAHKFELLLQELPHVELRAILHTLLCHGYTREGGQLGVSLVKGDQIDLRFYNLPLLGSLYLAVSASTRIPPLQSKNAATPESLMGEQTQAVLRIYRRRLEVYGDADTAMTDTSSEQNVFDDRRRVVGDDVGFQNSTMSRRSLAASSMPLDKDAQPIASAATALVRTSENHLIQALVLASTRPATSRASYATAELANCFLNRRATVAGRGVVVDVGYPASQSQSRHGGGVVFRAWLRKGTAT